MQLFLLLMDTIGEFGRVAAIVAAYYYGVKALCVGFRKGSEWVHHTITRPAFVRASGGVRA